MRFPACCPKSQKFRPPETPYKTVCGPHIPVLPPTVLFYQCLSLSIYVKCFRVSHLYLTGGLITGNHEETKGSGANFSSRNFLPHLNLTDTNVPQGLGPGMLWQRDASHELVVRYEAETRQQYQGTTRYPSALSVTGYDSGVLLSHV